MKHELTLTSIAFVDGDAMPTIHTCDGENVSPPLAWRGAPDGARSLALVMDDPDAPDPKAPRRVFVHWVLYDLPVADGGLADGVRDDALPRGARQGVNDRGSRGYTGPCPPIGRHRYFFTLYALDMTLPGLDAPTRNALEMAIAGHVLATAQLMGTYERPR